MSGQILDKARGAFIEAMVDYPDEFEWEIIGAILPSPQGMQLGCIVVMTLPEPVPLSSNRFVESIACPAIWALQDVEVCKQIIVDLVMKLRSNKQNWLSGK